MDGGGDVVVDIIIYGVFKVKRKAFYSPNSVCVLCIIVHYVLYRRFVAVYMQGVVLDLYLSLCSALSL